MDIQKVILCEYLLITCVGNRVATDTKYTIVPFKDLESVRFVVRFVNVERSVLYLKYSIK